MKSKIILNTTGIPGPSETFLNLHLKRLDFQKWHLYSTRSRGFFPVYCNGTPLFSDSMAVNYLEAGIDRLFRENTTGYWLRKHKIKQLIKTEGIEGILSEYGPLGAMMYPVAKENNLPLFVYFHGRDAYHYQTLRRFKRQYQEMFNYASRLFVVSADMREELITLGAPQDKIVLNPCAPNNAIFDLSQPISHSKKIISVARFVPKKSPDLLVKMFASVYASDPEASMLMVGDGRLLPKCKALANELGVEQAITFSKVLSPREIAIEMKNAQIFAQHSVRAQDGDSEGTPVSVLEAMVSGLPVVATAHAGIKDAVVHGETGFLVEEKDVESMSNYVTELVADFDKCKKMGEMGQKRINEKYNLEQHLRVIETEIKQILSQN